MIQNKNDPDIAALSPALSPVKAAFDPEYERRHDAWLKSQGNTFRHLWTVDILSLPEMPHFLLPRHLGVQTANTREYISEGRTRIQEEHCYFCCTLDGVGAFSDRQGVHLVPEGQAFLTEIADPATAYFYPGTDRRPWRFLAFTFEGLAARAMVRDLVEQYGHLYNAGVHSPIIQRLLGFQTSSHRTLHPHALEGAALVLDLLLGLGAQAREAEVVDPLRTMVQDALELMDTELENDLSVARIAQQMGISRERLSRSFQKHLGQSPQQVIREMKMRRASFLLKNTQLTVSKIAAMFGYSDQTNFSHAFRKVMGMPPAEFRLRGIIPLLQPYSRRQPDSC